MIWKKENGSVSIVPDNVDKDLPICPYRDDWFQSECWICDWCGRNEEAEHGVEFETVEIDGFQFFKDGLKKVDDEKIVYGCKMLKR